MNFIPKKIAHSILLATCLIGFGTAQASILNFTGKSGNLGHSFTETNNGVNITVSAFKFSGSNSTPSNAGAQSTIMQAYGNHGLGIGYGGNPEHTADNRGDREFFLVEFDQSVNLSSASISEWGNNHRSTYGGDSDVDYWGGAGTFDFDNLGTLFGDNVDHGLLGNGQTRNIMFDSGLGSVNWLLLGPEAFGTSVYSFIKLRNINYDVAAVPLPATVWLMGSALLGLGGLKRKYGQSNA